MTKLESGSIIKYILGEKLPSFDKIEKMVLENNNLDEAKLNYLIVSEDLAAYKVMTAAINKNKWKEGLKGGAIAGSLIVGISSAISPINSLTAAAFRMFSGMVTGGTSALIYSKMDEQCCNGAIAKRIVLLESMLETAQEKLQILDNRRPSI